MRDLKKLAMFAAAAVLVKFALTSGLQTQWFTDWLANRLFVSALVFVGLLFMIVFS